jgi:hypothetical protein
MTVPQVNTDSKNPSAVIDNFDDTRSTIGLQSEYNSVVSIRTARTFVSLWQQVLSKPLS